MTCIINSYRPNTRESRVYFLKTTKKLNNFNTISQVLIDYK